MIEGRKAPFREWTIASSTRNWGPVFGGPERRGDFVMTCVVTTAQFENAARAATMGELLSSCFPHFDNAIAAFAPGHEVVGEGDETENYFFVVRGLFRAVKFTRDGRRQVFAFYVPGDICGLEPDATHNLTIESVGRAAMAILPRRLCRQWMNADPQLNATFFDAATRALTLSVNHMTMIGRSSAEERLAWFLVMLAARSARIEQGLQVIDLEMQRQDIADYLGLTIETISRTFTQYKDRGLIRLATTRRIEILRPDALAALAAADRDATPKYRAALRSAAA
jgi:CRP-like cAMP-binding protein